MVVGEAIAKRERQGEHPLPHRHLRQHPVDKMRGGLGHTASAARAANASALARERHHAIAATLVAMHANQSVLRHPAGEEVAKRGLDQTRQRMPTLQCCGKEAIEFLGDHLIKQHPLGASRLVEMRRGNGLDLPHAL